VAPSGDDPPVIPGAQLFRAKRPGLVLQVQPHPAPDDEDRLVLLAVELERQAIKNYAERAGQAEAAGEIGLKVRLEEILADETDHAEEIVRLLGGRGGD